MNNSSLASTRIAFSSFETLPFVSSNNFGCPMLSSFQIKEKGTPAIKPTFLRFSIRIFLCLIYLYK
ncbi:predicted protein [Enterococcus faecium 1,231,501]|nr:predicted protein [Enterococcus faecium 1,231,501]